MPKYLLDGDELAKGIGLFRFRRHAALAGPSARSVERRPARLGILHDPRAQAGRPARTCPMSSSRPAGSVVWGLDSTFFDYVRADENHRPLHVYRHRLGTPQSDDVLVYEEEETGWFADRESASRAVSARRHRQPGDVRALADRSRRMPMPRRDSWRCARPPSATASRIAAASCSSSPTRAMPPTFARHGAVGDAGPRAMARADPPPPRHLHHHVALHAGHLVRLERRMRCRRS